MSTPLILVSDDNQEIREFLEEILTSLGTYRVHLVGDGLSALSLVQELKPQLVITDQQMPNLKGMELIRRMQKDFPQIPVVLMTGEGSEALAVEAFRGGAADYLVKPFDPDQLLEIVDRCLSMPSGAAVSQGGDGQYGGSEAQSADTLQEVAPIKEIGRELGVGFDLEEVLSAAVDTAVQLTGAEEGSLLLLDEETGKLHMRASKNFDDEFSQTFHVRVDDSLAGRAISSGEPVRLDEKSPQKIKTAYLVHSLLYVPMKVRGRTIGVLGVDNRTPGKKLREEDTAILEAMAGYAALAIENAQLYLRSETERLQLETILTQVENGVIVIDSEDALVLINRSAQEALGIEAEVLGLMADQIFRDPKLIALMRTSGENPRREEIELDDGRVLSALRTPIKGVGQVIVMQDITHLKELDRIKSEFVTTVSHDLRSPLTAILGYVELIDRAGPTNPQQKEFIRRIHSSVQQISSLITDLLDLGRIESGIDTAKEYVEIAELLREVAFSLEGYARTEDIHFKIEMPERIGMVFGDPIRLRQMVGNLLENAIKYTPGGGEVQLEAHFEDDQVILRVSDTGAGIPRAEHPYLFDRFYRASNVPEDLPGTGLGLSIVKSILDNHHGRIWVESDVGNGTTFTVVLPLVEA
jgi:two-component system NtrC family sensor kinase